MTETTGTEARAVRVMLVEDHADFRRLLAAVVGRQPDMEVVAQAGSMGEARARISPDGCDVTVLDMGLPDGDGLGLVCELRQANPSIRIFVISSTAETRHPGDAVGAGADGIIDKMDAPEEMFEAIRG